MNVVEVEALADFMERVQNALVETGVELQDEITVAVGDAVVTIGTIEETEDESWFLSTTLAVHTGGRGRS